MRWLATTLVGLLGLAWALIAFAAPGTKVRPAPDDRGAGGLSLFAAALRDAGYRVAFDPSTRPRLRKDEVAIVPVLQSRDLSGRTPSAVLGFAAAGGRAFVLGVSDRLQAPGERLQVKDVNGKKATIDLTYAPGLTVPGSQIAAAAYWSAEDGPISTLSQVGEGRIARLEHGVLATNRFLGRVDNARVVFSTLAKIARPSDRLVFLAGGYGEAEEPGPFESIGPWAVGALWQSLAVFAAFGVAKGVRFGLPVPEVRTRRGARELLDALAGHYRRGRRTDAPLTAAARERPDDFEVQALAAKSKVPEAEARRALTELEARPRKR